MEIIVYSWFFVISLFFLTVNGVFQNNIMSQIPIGDRAHKLKNYRAALQAGEDIDFNDEQDPHAGKK